MLVSKGGKVLVVSLIIIELVLLDDIAEGGNNVLKFIIPLLDIVEVGNQDRVTFSKKNIVLLTVSKVVDS